MSKWKWVYFPQVYIGIREKLLISFTLLFSVVFVVSYYWLYRAAIGQVVVHLQQELLQTALFMEEAFASNPSLEGNTSADVGDQKHLQEIYRMISLADLASGHHYHYIFWQVTSPIAFLRFAQVLHIDAIAEGIETERQKMILRRMRCKYGQGCFYAKPLTATQVLDLLHRLNADTLPV
ncbi:MAG: EAL domain-containing protein [Synechococcales cyanobacterium T60_A2020_003]|nr:EAL domain-containing protein [Synechococcales cyanobacterium T60_A2020_003]